MNFNPLVSICIPAYNSEKWIKSTIQSAISQTWKNKEIVIVDDGSTDDTYSVAKQFESDTIKVIKQNNLGACAARNKALSLASGDFIQWLDSDDILSPEKVEIQLSDVDFSANPAVLHSSAFGLFHHRIKSAKFNPTPLWRDLDPLEWLIISYKNGYWMYPAVWLVSRKITEMAGSWDERLTCNQDGEYFSRVVAASELVKFHEKAKSYYRKGNPSSITSTRVGKALDSIVLSKNLQVETLLNLKDTQKTKEASVNCLQRAIFGYNLDPHSLASIRDRIIELGGVVTPPRGTVKYRIVKEILGFKIAKYIKGKLWYVTKLSQKYWEWFCSLLFRDGI